MEWAFKKWLVFSGFVRKNWYWLLVVVSLAVLPWVWFWWGTVGANHFVQLFCVGEGDCKRLEKLGQVGDIFGGVNALFAAFALGAVAISTDLARKAYRDENQWRRDEKSVEQVIRSYEWAFNALTDNGAHIPPEPNRLNWLTCSRHILRAQRLAESVNTATLRTIMEEHTEFWRHQFYLALDSNVFSEAGYFFTGHTLASYPEGIEITSGMVTIDFSNWQAGIADPTKYVNRSKLIEQGKPYQGKAGRAFKNYVTFLEESLKTMKEKGGKANDTDEKSPTDT